MWCSTLNTQFYRVIQITSYEFIAQTVTAALVSTYNGTMVALKRLSPQSAVEQTTCVVVWGGLQVALMWLHNCLVFQSVCMSVCLLLLWTAQSPTAHFSLHWRCGCSRFYLAILTLVVKWCIWLSPVSCHRFSAFWLRSKCSICSYQLNIWYGGHVPPSILNWFLQGDEVQELAPASSRVGLALQYRQDRPTSPLMCDLSPPHCYTCSCLSVCLSVCPCVIGR